MTAQSEMKRRAMLIYTLNRPSLARAVVEHLAVAAA